MSPCPAVRAGLPPVEPGWTSALFRHRRTTGGPFFRTKPLSLRAPPESLVPVIRVRVRQGPGTFSAISARRLPDLHDPATADRAVALPGTVRARAVAGRDGRRLLRFPHLARSNFRRLPRRIVRGAQRRRPGAGLPARRRRPWRVGRAGICGQRAEGKARRGARPCPVRRHPRLHRQGPLSPGDFIGK